MPCFHPLKGFRSLTVNPNGKRPIVFNRKDGFSDMPVSLPCGQCIGCRLERSRQWAIRCVHESSLYEDNCFITLTFSDENLPEDMSLDVRHFQLFMKRLRKRFGDKIRFFHCGEYGEQYGRPHYHACIFNFDFPDKTPWRKSPTGHTIYRSQALEELWPHGFSEIGTVTFESAAYVARYIMKKVTGDAAEAHYTRMDAQTGEITYRKPEYTTMSRRPGIGRGWYDRFFMDVYPSDFVVMNGKKIKPPKYYDNTFELTYPSDFHKLKIERKRDAEVHADNNTPERLEVREKVQLAKLQHLPRPLDQNY